MLEDAAHDAVATGVNLYAHLLLVGVAGVLNGIGMYLSVLKLNAVGYLAHVGSGDVLVEADMVDFLLAILRVSEFAGQFSIVGEEQHARGVEVKTSDGIDALVASTLDEFHDGLAVLGVVAGGDVAFGFVEKYVDLLLHAHGLVVETNLVGAEHFGAEFGDHLSVDGDYASLNVVIGIAAAAYTCVGEVFVEAHGCIGVELCIFVVYTPFVEALLIVVVVAGTEGSALLRSIART